MAHDLASLITVLDGILHPTDQEDQNPDDHKKALLESLLEKATSLMNLLEKCTKQHHLSDDNISSGGSSSGNSSKEIIDALQSEVRDAAHEAEDIIESHAIDHMLSGIDASRFPISPPDHIMSRVMEVFEAANDKLIEIITEYDQSHEDVIICSSSSVAADPTSSKPNIAMVGFDDDALHLKYRLTSRRREREIIPIVGMGGIGKTTLARDLYNDPLIVSHFDVRAWVTLSQDYNARALLLGLLGCIFGKISDHMLNQNDGDLGLTLYQRLCGSRYLVVLDDIWSEKAWDEIKVNFPTENNRSRILITSRELHVAKYPDSTCAEHQMHLLSSAQGWDLLRRKVFDVEKEESCPPFLEEIGQKIVRDCGGLPLAIAVIGGLLSPNKYSKDLWEQVAEDVHAILSQRDEHFSKILSLSYDNLPLHLKPCFLYMAAFPEDFEVKGSKLVKLWLAEGFLWRSSGNKENSEDVAEEYLKALVDRNLILVTSTKSNGRAKSYSMHDLMRDLCVRKADDEKFLHVVKNEKVLKSSRRVSVHRFTEYAPNLGEHLSLSRSLLCISPRSRGINFSLILSTLRLLRVLDLYDRKFDRFPRKILKLVNLRFLAIKCSESLPSGIWRLPNLQTLISDYHYSVGLTLSYEAWAVLGLRHVVAKLIFIDFKITRVHENLQTICDVSLRDLLYSNLINNMPNVKKLGIRVDRYLYRDIIIDLSRMHKLETLKLISGCSEPTLSPFKFPNCLKKLSLYGCTIPVGFLNDVVGALQYLEALEITECPFQTEERNKHDWVLNEEVEFCSLEYLVLEDCYVMHWKADSSNFPRLRHLKIHFCMFLKEIPTSFGEISTLETIEVDKGDPSHVAWAKEIIETQSEYGNENVQLRML